ncbi:5-formyltetrahydrofolate cyclo-ligase [Eikenella sp. S3360]|uniref:5-formyltetrahydrofolate cyclo-ligase n=1 Tax=Eikenella glucosivorans TaxID=2766967 RepID=A0ABS0NCW6_9NEIS|nr:5-formyltetrahydrofolate cyclo-ligase [Eikenella glucosivorans]MBH5330102.1 5-formyltetrahydrofolate cyclo-ligase [Eikenella glucosivorans]
MTQTNAKNEIRRHLRRTRQAIPLIERQRAEQRINRLLKGYLKRGKRLAVYWPIGSELRLSSLITAARARGTRLYLPYIQPGKQRLWFTPYPAAGRPERQRKGKLRIPQFAGRKIRIHNLHGIIVPLIGIDKRGYRMGQGGGYYDVTFAATRHRLCPLKIGAGFACQQTDILPTEPHDMRLDKWVCETGVQHFDKY